MELKVDQFKEDELDLVFGDDSVGANPFERARSSRRIFVRGQVQLAFASPRSKGWKLSAHEALDAFGWPALLQVGREGYFVLVSDQNEPAKTLRQARKDLGLSTDQLARRSRLNADQIEKAETGGELSPISVLHTLAQTLALDPVALSFESGARGDQALSVRLRSANYQADAAHFSPSSVFDMAEAGWTIREQTKLSRTLGLLAHPLVEGKYQRDANYAYPAHFQGYRLAEKTRYLLGLGDGPLPSLRGLVEDMLNIPLVQNDMGTRFAGATISIAGIRGIVVNTRGWNQNVWVRRMTLSHELGHLLWDPEQRLNKLRVDDYNAIEGDSVAFKDPVEMRANAFAVAFLAPPTAVRELVDQIKNPREAIEGVSKVFGVSYTAAKYHIKNVCNKEIEDTSTYGLPGPSDEWTAAENFTIDYFPIKETPISCRGKFAWFVVECLKENLIGTDSACLFLKCTEADLTGFAPSIDALWDTASNKASVRSAL